MKRSLAAAAIFVALFTVGCTSGGDDAENTKTETEKSEAAGSEGTDTISPSDLPDAPELDDPKGIVTDVTVEDCTVEPPLTANGVVKNTAKDARDMVITINWATDKGDVLGRGVAVLEGVEAGAEAEWKLESDAEPPAEVSCTTNARAGTLAE